MLQLFDLLGQERNALNRPGLAGHEQVTSTEVNEGDDRLQQGEDTFRFPSCSGESRKRCPCFVPTRRVSVSPTRPRTVGCWGGTVRTATGRRPSAENQRMVQSIALQVTIFSEPVNKHLLTVTE